MSYSQIKFTNPEGEEMIVHPANEATHGVYIGEDQLKGSFMDAPVKSEWDSTAMQEGGTQRGVDFEYRDFTVGFYATENSGLSAEEADSIVRMFFDYEEDEWDPNPIRQTRCTLTTDLSGERHIDILMSEAPDQEWEQDPFAQQFFDTKYSLRAGQPMWYEMINGQPYKITAVEFGSGNHDLAIEVENRTDRVARHSWVVAAGVGTKVWLPDVSWTGAKGAREPGGDYMTRQVQLPTIQSVHAGGFRVSLNMSNGRQMIVDMGNTNVLGQMPVPGSYFMHRIPHYTPRQTIPIHIESAPAGGGRVELRMPLLWSRPVGLERW